MRALPSAPRQLLLPLSRRTIDLAGRRLPEHPQNRHSNRPPTKLREPKFQSACRAAERSRCPPIQRLHPAPLEAAMEQRTSLTVLPVRQLAPVGETSPKRFALAFLPFALR